MASVSESQLASMINSGDIKRAYYFYGADVMAVKKYTDLIVKKLTGGGADDLNYHTFEGRTLDAGEFIDACEALPVFGDSVLVTVYNLNAEELNAGDLDAVISEVSQLPDTTTVIFFNTGVDLYKDGKYLSSKNSKLSTAVGKAGISLEFTIKKSYELADAIVKSAAKKGGKISKSDADYLAQLCLCNTMLIDTELSKLISYDSNITKATIDLLTPRQLDAKTFDLAKAVVKRDVRTAMALLNDLFELKTEPIAIVSALIMSMNDLYRARIALNERVSVSQAVEDFGYKSRRFAMENAYKSVGSTSPDALRSAMGVLAKTDLRMKSERCDKQVLLEQSVIEMISLVSSRGGGYR